MSTTASTAPNAGHVGESNEMSSTALGQVVVITGCSSGIGLHLALQLCDSPLNYSVITTVRKLSTASTLLTSNSLCDVIQADVTCEDDMQRIKRHIEDTYDGRCDVLVNNAGYGVSGCIEDVSVDTAKRVFDVNVWGPMRLCQLLVPLMRSRGNGGLIMTVSSMSGVVGQPYSDVYTASKFAIEGLMESFRYAVQHDNIKVVSVNPGATNTSFATRFKKESKTSGVAAYWAQEIASRNVNGQPVSECAEKIVEVLEREFGKDVRDGRESAVMWNGTSMFSQKVIERVKLSPDGVSGIYKERFEVGRKMYRDAQARALGESNGEEEGAGEGEQV